MVSDGALNVSGDGSYDATTYGGPNHCADSVQPGVSFPAGYPKADPTDYPWPVDFTNSPPACTYSGTSFSRNSGTIPSGVYCATSSITISGYGISGNVTLIAPTVAISGNNNNLTPYTKNLLIYQTGSAPLSISGNNMEGGWVFAPNAQVTINGNNWTMTGNGPNILVNASLIL